jgi:hypothetical protein
MLLEWIFLINEDSLDVIQLALVNLLVLILYSTVLPTRNGGKRSSEPELTSSTVLLLTAQPYLTPHSSLLTLAIPLALILILIHILVFVLILTPDV